MKGIVKFLRAALCGVCALSLTLALLPVSAQAAERRIVLDGIEDWAEEYEIGENVVDAFEDAADRRGRIAESDFKALAQELLDAYKKGGPDKADNKITLEFLQQFFDDCFVYNENGMIVYQPVDEELAMNAFNWQNLVETTDGRVHYMRGGKSRAYTGVDVSAHQGEIDWERVADDGIRFAMIRLGNRGWGTGKLVVDEYFHRNAAGAAGAGLPFGVYFYSQAVSKAEAREEARLVVEQLEGYDVAFPVVYDIEQGSANGRVAGLTPRQITDNAIAFCETIEEAGYRPAIYSYTTWFITRMELSRLEKYDKWLAQYYDRPFFPYQMRMWQYTSAGSVDGIKGGVDLNLCFYDYLS